ncbi:MAG: peptidylprolyl isomerase [Thalassobius sp.]|nr:peptidylprolyl isomerase [Thalassovita sp.]
MNFNRIFIAALLISGITVSCNNMGGAGGNVSINSSMDSVSYSAGVSIGNNLKPQTEKDSLNIDALLAGLSDVLKGSSDLKLTEEQCNQILQTYSMRKQQEMVAATQKEATTNLEKGQAFLAENGKKDGVTTTESGLQYEVITEGSGPSPKATDQVTVHYHGTTIDGTVFDSSVDRGEPASFPLNGVIKGWTEGLQLMKTGAKYKFYIPANLAYGSQRRSEEIGPNETLIFEVELLSVGGAQ